MFFSTLIVSIVLTLILYSPIMRLLGGANCTKPNWRKRYVVSSFGILIPIVMVTALAIFSIQVFASAGVGIAAPELVVLLLLVVTACLVGFIDDILGSRVIGGFKGHFSQLRFGIMTTGTLKAIVGFSIAVVVSAFISKNILMFLLNILVIALSINAANLFDLRPGRAIKVFAISSIAVFIASWSSSFWDLWGLIIPPIGGLLWGDLKEHSMMGDSGANVLGAIIGLAFVINLSWITNLVILGILIGLHVVAEKHSISLIVERIPLIKHFDEWGIKR